MTRILLSAALLCVASQSWATAPCHAIVGGKAYLPTGPADNVTVVIRGSRIVSVKVNGPVPEGCARVNAQGQIVTPGFVDVSSQLGLVEVDLEKRTVDFQSASEGKIRAAFQAARAYNPRSTLIPIARIAGVTSAVITPRGGLISGQAAWVDLSGATQASTVKRLSVGMLITLRGGDHSRAGMLHTLDEVLEDAAFFAARRKEWDAGRSRPFAAGRMDLAALKPVLDGQLPVILSVDRAAEIEAALALAARYKFKLVIAGGAEAWMLAKQLAEQKVAVITNPVGYSPASFERVHTRRNNAALLSKAGVTVLFSTFWTHNVRTLSQIAGNAVRAGLSHTAAIRALTQAPAEVFGMTEHGRLAAGAIANVVVWSGDPLELTTHPTHLFISGSTVLLESRQTHLRDRYLKQYTPSPIPLP